VPVQLETFGFEVRFVILPYGAVNDAALQVIEIILLKKFHGQIRA